MTISATTTDFPDNALREALAIAVADGSLTDTVYYLFSRRTASGKVGSPRAVYASSLIMKAASEHFCAQLSGGFSIDDKISEDTEGYSYEDDSDIDEDEDINERMEAVADEGSVGSGSSADSPVVVVAPDKGKEKPAVPEEASRHRALQDAADAAKGVKYKVFIPDVAARTWQALVYLVYTGKVYFAPLKSRGIEYRRLARQQHEERFPKGPPLCSPKSMYRLADIVGLNSLKRIAESAIKASLCEMCIADEIFSHFSSTYTDVLDAELQFLYRDGTLARALDNVNQHIRSVVQGSLPHTETALSLLLEEFSEILALGRVPVRHGTPWNDALTRIPIDPPVCERANLPAEEPPVLFEPVYFAEPVTMEHSPLPPSNEAFSSQPAPEFAQLVAAPSAFPSPTTGFWDNFVRPATPSSPPSQMPAPSPTYGKSTPAFGDRPTDSKSNGEPSASVGYVPQVKSKSYWARGPLAPEGSSGKKGKGKKK